MADGSVTIDTKLDTDGLKSGLGKIGSIASGALKGATVAIGAVTTAFAGMVTASVKARGELEQNIGGVETLFKGSADKVIENANNAYKTAGMSANEYMQNVTSFSASLLQSVAGDTDKAADIADMAMRDMSDNANKMGTDMASIQNAYQGFAKQNYTMLDNLKLGYGGTKTEMERLLRDAEKITGIKYDISNLSDVYQAIHVIQGELGITGTTALEAEKTLTGSIASLKASWNNFLSGSGNLSQVVKSAEIAFENIIRIVSEAVPDIINNLTQSLPELIDIGRKLLDNILNGIMTNLPELIKGAGQIISTLANAILQYLPQLADGIIQISDMIVDAITTYLPKIIPAIVEILQKMANAILNYTPKLVTAGIQIIIELVRGISETLPTLIPAIVDAIMQIAEAFLDNIDAFIDAGIQLILALADGLIQALPRLIEKIPVIIEKYVTAILNNLPKIIEAGIQLILKLIDGLIQALPKLIEAIPKIIDALITAITENLPKIIEAGIEMTIKLAEGLIDALPKLIEQIPVLIEKLVSAIINNLPKIIEAGFTIVVKLAEGLVKAIPRLVSKVPEIIGALFRALADGIGGILEIGANIVQGIWDGICGAWDWLVGKVTGFASDILGTIMGALGIHSPSRLFRDKVGKNIALGIGEGFEDNISKVYRDMKSAVDFETQRLSANLSTSANYSKVLTANINVNGAVEMDGDRVGRLVAPAVSKTLKTAGA